ncbi:MAG: hypothetical protein RML40_03410 [Bacteroidota bacterium]|nr:hypothetical protein [Candidatus Kapabacteria bacterium]MDW8219559.1 hypothetical protein [Bacteroidota bacterium]
MASWFNINSGGAIVAKRASLSNTVSVHGAEHSTTHYAFSVFPKPAQELVTVHFTLTTSQRFALKLFNALGQNCTRAR